MTNLVNSTHVAPAYLRSDNGPEVVAHAVQRWLQVQQVQTAYIEPGSPWQNAYAERVRDECLNVEWFRNVHEARVVIGLWQQQYHEARPHSSLGYQTPREFRRAYERERGNQVGPCRLSNIEPVILTV